MATSFLFDYLADKIHDYIYNATAAGLPASMYAALYTTAPLSSGGGVEVAGFSYARQGQTRNTTNFPVSVSRTIKNATILNYGTATGGDWGVIVGAAWRDASVAGNGLMYGSFGTPVTVLNGGTFSIAVNAMTSVI